MHGTYSEPMANTRIKYGLLHLKQQAHIFTTIETGCVYQIKIENSKGKWVCDGLGVFKQWQRQRHILVRDFSERLMNGMSTELLSSVIPHPSQTKQC